MVACQKGKLTRSALGKYLKTEECIQRVKINKDCSLSQDQIQSCHLINKNREIQFCKLFKTKKI